eukprot:3471789-Lingulodinium_polyedra.AAC.1
MGTNQTGRRSNGLTASHEPLGNNTPSGHTPCQQPNSSMRQNNRHNHSRNSPGNDESSAAH